MSVGVQPLAEGFYALCFLVYRMYPSMHRHTHTKRQHREVECHTRRVRVCV